jgi:hypothetical protein
VNENQNTLKQLAPSKFSWKVIVKSCVYVSPEIRIFIPLLMGYTTIANKIIYLFPNWEEKI